MSHLFPRAADLVKRFFDTDQAALIRLGMTTAWYA
jgi:hypothetical protein